MKTEDIKKRLEAEMERDIRAGTYDVLVRTLDDEIYLGYLVRKNNEKLELKNAWQITQDVKQTIFEKYNSLSEQHDPGQALCRHSYRQTMIESINVRATDYYPIQNIDQLEPLVNKLMDKQLKKNNK